MLWRLLSAAVGVAVVFTMARSERRHGDSPFWTWIAVRRRESPWRLGAVLGGCVFLAILLSFSIAIALGSKGPTWAATVLFSGTVGSGIFLLGGVNTLRNR